MVLDSGGLSDTELGMIAEFAAGYLTNELTDDVKGIQNLKCRVLLPISYSHPQTKTHQVYIYIYISIYPSIYSITRINSYQL